MRRSMAVPGSVKSPAPGPVEKVPAVAHRGPRRAALFAAAGYGGTLGAGWLASRALTGDGSVADLAVAAVTVLVLAPLAGLVGAGVAFWPYRRIRLTRGDAGWFWAATAVVYLVSSAEWVWLGAASSLTTALMGSTALVVMRVALLERRHASSLTSRGAARP